MKEKKMIVDFEWNIYPIMYTVYLTFDIPNKSKPSQIK